MAETVFLIRHGQAGTRDDYDRLSPLGEEQALCLARYLLREGISFDRWIAGGLRRQQQTAQIVHGAFRQAGQTPPEIEVDARWSEFDLDQVYAGIAPQIAAEDAAFRAHYEEMLARIRAGDGTVHRQWTPADTQVVRAWIEQRFPFEGESWADFLDRVQQAFRDAANGAARRVAIFTSATPAAITVASVFGSRAPLHIMRMAGAALNANFTIVDVRGGAPSLSCFNAVPHLDDPRLRTYR
ncbi:MAG: histidine phosphatase family protein [Bryobacteraceae bacterium]|nr:histidine phosphatase family protein [Bryobacteraceae bacterium]